MNDDAADLAAARDGDHEAFARLYDRHAAVVLSLCRQRIPASEAEDATQETFIRAHHRLERLEASEKFRPWLYGIARRVCSERRRAAGRRSKHEDQAMLRSTAERVRPAGSDEQADRVEQLDRLDTALDQLPDQERLAIHLYYLDTDPVAAASVALGVSRSGYYKLLARARERLAAILNEVITS